MGVKIYYLIMYNNPLNEIFLYHNLKLHRMIDMHSKYDNMHTNGIFNVLNALIIM